MSSLEPQIVPDDQHHDQHHDPGDTRPEPAPPLEVEVRRHAAVAALVGAASSAMAIAYVTRAVSTGGVLDWVFGLVLGAVGVSQLVALVDARTPLLVADGFGIRLRLGREWRGLPWDSLEQVVVEPRTSLIHDGRLVVAPRHLNRALEGLDRKARRQVALSQKLYAAPLVVPLGMTTRVSTDDLVAELARLSQDRAAVVEIAGYVAQPVVPDSPETVSPRERIRESPARRRSPSPTAAPRSRATSRAPRGCEVAWARSCPASATDGPTTSTPTRRATSRQRRRRRRRQQRRRRQPLRRRQPHRQRHPGDHSRDRARRRTAAPAYPPAALLRDARPAARIDVRLDQPALRTGAAPQLQPDGDGQSRRGLPEDDELRRRDEEWEREGVVPIARPGHAVAPLVIDDFAIEPALAPVIGPRIEQARTRLGFGIDTLSTRTRIRPHVLEAIEVDDFEPCGGDFYARGHLRTLSTVLGLPGEELLADFDERYASAPINARRVFEAELATGMPGGVKTSLGGPRWGLVMGVVLALVLAWGLARLLTDTPEQVTTQSPVLNGSAGLAPDQKPITSSLGTPVKMTVKAVRGPSDVLVRDRSGAILWAGHLTQGGHRQLFGTGPFTVRAVHPAAVDVWVAGKLRGPVGDGDHAARRTFR